MNIYQSYLIDISLAALGWHILRPEGVSSCVFPLVTINIANLDILQNQLFTHIHYELLLQGQHEIEKRERFQ